MILAIVFAVLGYRKAKQTGRNKVLWALVMGLLYIAVQIVILLIGVVGISSLGWDPILFDTYTWPINIGGWVIGILVCSGVLYLLGRSPMADVQESPAEAELGASKSCFINLHMIRDRNENL